MTFRFGATAFAVVTLSLAGCSAVDVYSQDAGKVVKQPGIPFYVKVPVLNHQTRRVHRDLEVQVELSDERGNAKPVAVTLPSSGPVRIEDTPEAQQELRAAFSKLNFELEDKTLDFQSAERSVAEKLDGLFPVPADRKEPEVLSNTWTMQMITGPRVYYVKNRVPFIGTATADFEFDSQGTLTKSNTSITDDTAKTLLSLLPITAELEKKWAINGTSGAGASIPAFSMTVKITQVDTVYTLVRIEELPAGSGMSAYALPTGKMADPLTYADAKLGQRGV